MLRAQSSAHLLIPSARQVSILLVLVGVDGLELVKVEGSQVWHGPGLGLTRLSSAQPSLLLVVSSWGLVQAGFRAQWSMRRWPICLQHQGHQQAANSCGPTVGSNTMANTMQGCSELSVACTEHLLSEPPELGI